jgi:hypothetical protein
MKNRVPERISKVLEGYMFFSNILRGRAQKRRLTQNVCARFKVICYCAEI